MAMRFPDALASAFLPVLFPFLLSAEETPRPAPVDPAPADLTASELASRGRLAFEQQNFPEAARLFSQLSGEYAESPAAAPLIENAKPMLALCLVKAGDFPAALDLANAALASPRLPAPAREELSFWRGICLLQTNEPTAAQEQFGTYYANPQHDRTRRFEAFLLFASGYLHANDPAGAAAFLADQIPKLPKDQGEVAGRASVLLLHSLIQSQQLQKAAQLVRTSFPSLSRLTQIVSFQLLTLQLSSLLLERNLPTEAIACLQRLWPHRDLLSHQRQTLAQWKERSSRLRRQGPQRAPLAFQTDTVITRIERELAEFEKIPDYDVSRLLQLAHAFTALERWYEAASLLDHVTVTFEPGPTTEKAALSAIECWQQSQHPHKTLAAADRYLQIFGEHHRGNHIPDALSSRAHALRSLGQLTEASATFGDLANEWPRHPLAPQAMLMGGICQLENHEEPAALLTFEALLSRFPQHATSEDARFWQAMTLSFLHRYPETIARFGAFLKSHPSSRYAQDAEFEVARATHNQLLHPQAIPLLSQFLKAHPSHRSAPDARLLLSESLMATGEINKGLAELRHIPRESTRLHEEAIFKTGEALARLERWNDAASHFASFIRENPRSRRLAEAAHQQARAATRAGQPETARSLAREAIRQFGNDPAAEGVEDFLLASQALHRGPDASRAFLTQLARDSSDAAAKGLTTLSLRLDWARGHFVLRSSPAEAGLLWFSLHNRIDPATHHPRITADCADACREHRNFPTATTLYSALRKWHPRSPERDRASLGLGLIAAAEQRDDDALHWLNLCLAESITGTAAADALLAKATILASRQHTAAALAALTSVTTNRLASPQHKSKALLAIGHLHLKARDPARAAPFFQRCYLSGAKFKASAAEARLHHGLCLEQLHDPDAATAIFRELLARPDLAAFPHTATARQRLASLAPTP
jgi:TolA-binding protein